MCLIKILFFLPIRQSLSPSRVFRSLDAFNDRQYWIDTECRLDSRILTKLENEIEGNFNVAMIESANAKVSKSLEL